MDITLDHSLIEEGLAREIINRIQRLRKKAGLQTIDSVAYFYKLSTDPEDQLKKAFASQEEFLIKALKQKLAPTESRGAQRIIVEEEQEVRRVNFSQLVTV